MVHYFVGLQLLVLAFVVPPAPLLAEGGMPAHNQEIQHLIEFVEISECRFKRNGKWHESHQAAAHIEKKYKYVAKRGRINSTEDFIKYAASKSSMSGKPYLVQCGDGEPMHCSRWLSGELAAYRNRK